VKNICLAPRANYGRAAKACCAAKILLVDKNGVRLSPVSTRKIKRGFLSETGEAPFHFGLTLSSFFGNIFVSHNISFATREKGYELRQFNH
jgi:hypothetical protein